MFKELFNLSYKRTKLQAFGFYIVWSLIFMIIAGLLNGIFAALLYPNLMQDGYNGGYKAGTATARYVVPICALVLTTSLSSAIIRSRKIFSTATLLLATASVLITPLFGCWIGMIPMAILTTFDKKCEEHIEE